MEERLQKLMARSGLGSRRDCEKIIAAGRVSVNGVTAALGQKANPETDHIVVDGAPLKKAETFVYIALNKPRNVLSTVDAPDPRRTVRELVDLPGMLYPVGRLDVDSEGLILLTNDGELANQLTHPRYGHEKEYRVLVSQHPEDSQLDAWRHGVVMEDGYRTTPADVRIESLAGKGTWLRVILREGRKRQIREMGARTGLPVVRIVRVRIGSLLLGSLKPGEWRRLAASEVSALQQGEQLPRHAAPRSFKVDRHSRRPNQADSRPLHSPAGDKRSPHPTGRAPRPSPKSNTSSSHPSARRERSDRRK